MWMRLIPVIGFLLAPGLANAQIQQLSLDADYCAIKRALVGYSDAECPPPPQLGSTRRVDPYAATIEESQAAGGYFIHFAFASDELTPDYIDHLNQLSEVMKSDDMKGACIKLVGHTDAVGSDQFNLALSQKRARTVMLYLIGVAEISKDMLIAEGQGKRALLPGIAGKDALNRRVEILVRPASLGPCQS